MKIMKQRHRDEQNYWLSFSDQPEATERQRQEFFRYDSQGGCIADDNPILLGKVMHGITGAVLRDSYLAMDGSWIGGLELVRDYCRRHLGLRSLREWFGEAAVSRWLVAAEKEVA